MALDVDVTYSGEAKWRRRCFLQRRLRSHEGGVGFRAFAHPRAPILNALFGLELAMPSHRGEVEALVHLSPAQQVSNIRIG